MHVSLYNQVKFKHGTAKGLCRRGRLKGCALVSATVTSRPNMVLGFRWHVGEVGIRVQI
jgi:hypothetical protein